MRSAPTQRIDRRAIRLWQVHGILLIGTLGLALVGAAMSLALTTSLPVYLVIIVAGAVLLYGALQIAVFPRIRWTVWRYELTEHELDLQSGLLVVRRTLIPLVRVQHVDTTQGPVAKLFHLSSVSVFTAASTHEIPALDDDTADELRDRISAAARTAREQL